ncbi:MAG: CC/Se motif family (seleno)protein [Halofilum sp. (in: g-proteobacteria)]|nr:CC/Se motif family (seleno)protein [Halofilum sp. (in: g-proteobacteria)]
MTGHGDLQLAIDPGAVDWIQRHGGAVTLRQSPRHGCCGGTAMLPVAEARTPGKPDEWITRRIEDVTVHIDPELDAQAKSFTIRAEGLRHWRRLFVETTYSQT